MDVNSKEAELWSENMHLKSENEHLKLVKRPVLWRAKDCEGVWIIYQDEADAYAEAQKYGSDVQGLYVRDGL